MLAYCSLNAISNDNNISVLRASCKRRALATTCHRDRELAKDRAVVMRSIQILVEIVRRLIDFYTVDRHTSVARTHSSADLDNDLCAPETSLLQLGLTSPPNRSLSTPANTV